MKIECLKNIVLGKLVRITADFNFRGRGDKEIKTVVGTVVDINKWGIEIGHPILPQTNEMTDCGIRNFELDKIVRIEQPSFDDAIEWSESYAKFHRMVIEEKGYDRCVEKFLHNEKGEEFLDIFKRETPIEFTPTTLKAE